MDDRNASQPAGSEEPLQPGTYMLGIFQGTPRDDVADFIVALRRLVELQDRIEKQTRYLVDSSDVRWEATQLALNSILSNQRVQQHQIADLTCQLQRFIFDQANEAAAFDQVSQAPQS